MGRLVVLLVLFVAACGGAQVPMHAGYKGKKPQPWKKAKALKFNDKGEAKVEGELAYGRYRRAAWFSADLPQPGKLDIRLEVTPPGDAINDEFDLGFEVLDPDYRVIVRSDLQEGDDTGELQKSKSLKDLEPGKYYIHLYLQHRLDSADYLLRASYEPQASAGTSDFPAQVPFVPVLAQVPLQDDTPKDRLPKTTTAVRKGPRTVTKAPPKPEEAAGPAQLNARILGMTVVGGGTQITIGVGTNAGASVGMKGKIVGVASAGTFEVRSCSERSCIAVVKATPDQIKASGSVVLTR